MNRQRIMTACRSLRAEWVEAGVRRQQRVIQAKKDQAEKQRVAAQAKKAATPAMRSSIPGTESRADLSLRDQIAASIRQHSAA